eukprot:888079-Pyramimonas_sp.AAC.1
MESVTRILAVITETTWVDHLVAHAVARHVVTSSASTCPPLFSPKCVRTLHDDYNIVAEYVPN